MPCVLVVRMQEMFKRARELAEIISREDTIKIVGHIDADGITSASIAAITLERLGKDYDVEFVKQLDPPTIERIKDENPPLVWFTDIGSGYTEYLGDLNFVITDHHIPSKLPSKSSTIIGFFDNFKKTLRRQLNPHLFGRDGATDMSGSVATYLVSREFGGNVDLSTLAIIGAIGDMQDTEENRLIGTNRIVLQEGVRAGYLDYFIDVRFFGRETRPIYKMLEFATEPIIPNLTGDEKACIRFLKNLGIKLKDRERWRRWIDLSDEERRKITNEIALLYLRLGYGHRFVKKMIGEVYILTKEEEGTPLHDVKEFATLLNSCGRYGKCEIGMRVCMGDRDKYYREALKMLNHHRRRISEGLRYVQDIGIVRHGLVQYFHAGDKIDENIVGIIASMVLSFPDIPHELPIIGFANSSDGGIKVSLRTVRENVEKGVNLGEIAKVVAKKCGGIGGGHNIAAGATIPEGTEEDFIIMAEKMVREVLE